MHTFYCSSSQKFWPKWRLGEVSNKLAKMEKEEKKAWAKRRLAFLLCPEKKNSSSSSFSSFRIKQPRQAFHPRQAPTVTAAASTSGREHHEPENDDFYSSSLHQRRAARGGGRGRGANAEEEKFRTFPFPTTAAAVSALALSLCLAGSPLAAPNLPANAEIETLAASEVLSAARPLPKQDAAKTKVSKGRIWTVFAVGAAGVFGGAVAAERLDNFFPAIAKANKAMEASRKAAEEAERQEAVNVAVEVATAKKMADGSLVDAVSEGIAEASRKAREQLKEGKK